MGAIAAVDGPGPRGGARGRRGLGTVGDVADRSARGTGAPDAGADRPFDPDDPGDQLALDALAAVGDPDVVPDGAVPWRPTDATGDAGLLPDWYMPAPVAGTRRLTGWRRGLAWLLVAASLAVVASGLCNTYGELVVA